MTRRNWSSVMLALCVAIALCLLTLRHYCYILLLGHQTSDPEFVSYQIDDVHRLVIGKDAALLINTKERVVLSLSPTFGRRLGPVTLWPRDSIHGVVLGDGVKGDVRDSYQFVHDGVNAHYGGITATHDLHVTL